MDAKRLWSWACELRLTCNKKCAEIPGFSCLQYSNRVSQTHFWNSLKNAVRLEVNQKSKQKKQYKTKIWISYKITYCFDNLLHILVILNYLRWFWFRTTTWLFDTLSFGYLKLLGLIQCQVVGSCQHFQPIKWLFLFTSIRQTTFIGNHYRIADIM